MIMGMTGFGARETEVAGFGRIRVEARSTNHKFLEIVVQLPEGFLSLEDRLKKEISSRIKRGRISCTVSLLGSQPLRLCINRSLLKSYISTIRGIREEFNIKGEMCTDTLLRLPGIMTLVQQELPKGRIWPRLRAVVNGALDDLLQMRRKEGAALSRHLGQRARALQASLGVIKSRFQKVIEEKLSRVATDEERSSLLKDTDITEEIERLAFHIKNYTKELSRQGPVGKELDFIAQEMQRETNTIGAKSCDTVISGQVIRIKSQVDKIREQVQNVE